MSDIIEVHGQYYIRANASIADAGTRVLKHGDTFAIFDRHGDVRPLGFESHGVFHNGTRFVSRCKLSLNGVSPLLLSSDVKEDNDFLVVDLTNPLLHLGGGRDLPHGSVHLVRTIFLWDGVCFERIEISSFAPQPVTLTLQIEYQSDFVDVFEVRGITRNKRGELRPPTIKPDEIVLAYEGLDFVLRETCIRFSLKAEEINDARAAFRVDLEPKETQCLDLRIICREGRAPMTQDTFEAAADRVHRDYRRNHHNITQIETSNPQFNDWLDQSHADLHLLLTRTDQGPYPYAGIPWFSCIFGRDAIITALEMLWIQPQIARAVLTYLAEHQATRAMPAKDAEPGKILHEERKGEMAKLGEVPFECYYGSIDSTPLWIILAGNYYERTADKELIARLWPNIEFALEWIDHYGDQDGDGFVEYSRKASGGLANQGWKDSEDSVFHADGSLPEPPIALCEVQGYVYEAKLRAAQLAGALGRHDIAKELDHAAQTLKHRFHKAFWCGDIRSYAIALDGQKRPCRVRSSNAGQCLFTGIAHPDAAAQIKHGLLTEEFFSGWGIRTLPTSEARYNPMSYHDGSIWPHDNALIALGLARYGFKQAATRVMTALFDASHFMDLNRLPELYCGFRRRRGEGPTLYPVACNPQAWASAAAFMALQACLGLRIDALNHRICFDSPHLPESIQQLDIKGLKVDDGAVDLSLTRQAEDVAVHVNRRSGKLDVLVIH
jgi:glycogen debranching enzyme